jgi:DNA-binding beta-propeller fold protein YncE
VALAAMLGVWLMLGSAAALAAGEPHPQTGEFGSFSNPNGIAIDESSGDVYVADIGTNTVYKFDENGNPVDFFALGSNALTGTLAGPFSFPASAYGTPAALTVDNACVRHTPALTGTACTQFDPSAGDLYVMDAGHGVIDKFSPSGEYLSQITGFAPAIGSPGANELLGLAVDTSGDVRADVSGTFVKVTEEIAVDVFDGSSANHLIARQLDQKASEVLGDGGLDTPQGAHGFAVGPTGDDYLLYESVKIVNNNHEEEIVPCSCVVKRGQQLAGLGKIDNKGSGDVAVSADPATGHVYVDNQASISEWDTGAMNGSAKEESEGPTSTGVLVGAPFGSLSGSSGQGGIAVNGNTGEIYVANPGAGSPGARKVDVFGSAAPAVTAGAASGVTKQAATLNGTVDPRGVAIVKCEFEYGVADEWGRGAYEQKVSCEQALGAIGAGAGPVPVSAAIAGMKAGLLYRFRLIAENANGLKGESSWLLVTLGEGFGAKNFSVSFLNKDGTPDTQAGSHPYKLVNTIEFESHFERAESNADSQYVREPGGTLKDLALDFPPGMVGDPNATAKKCTLNELQAGAGKCTPEAFVGEWRLQFPEHVYYAQAAEREDLIYNMVPPRGVAVQLGVHYELPDLFINAGLLAGGDYPIQVTVLNPPTIAPVLVVQVTVYGDPPEAQAERRQHELEKELAKPVPLPSFTPKAFLTLPTGCHGPLRSTLSMDSYQDPGQRVEKEEVTRNAAGTPVSLTGCSKLQFPPEIGVAPDSTNASTSSGLTVKVHVPQTAALNGNGLAESSLRDATVTLPEGVALNPAGADGLEACSADTSALPAGALGSPGDQIGYKGFEQLNKAYEPGVETATFTPELPNPLLPGSNFCPNGSKIATVKIKTPLLEHELEGAVYLASQNANPFGSLVALYIVAEDEHSGSLVKLTGEVKLTATGQIVATFENTPDVPFEDLEMHMFGGERAPLTTPSRCGTYTTTAVFTPWDGNSPVTSTSSFKIEHGPDGGPCPGASLPFNPSLAAGTTSIQAGGFSPFTMTMSREDGNQSLQAVSLKMPPGLSGLLTGVELCGEAQANAGTCGPNSQIGETTVSVGVGNNPFSVKGGRVYLTGPYRGAPFGLSIVNPAKAGPFDVEHDTSKPSEYMPACDCLVVRAKIEVDPVTADLTITSDNEGPYKIPPIIDGIPLQIKHVNVTINRPGFTFNPTNCSPMSITGSLDSTESATSTVSVPFQATNCARLSFKPKFSVSTSGKTSRKNGASLHVKLVYPKLPFGSQANIASVKVDLPRQLPSRLTTLQKACVDRVFDSNPGACPAGSRVGTATATTPLLPVRLSGPAYFVSHGGAKFPELVIVLQGYGVTVDLHSETFIDKAGITSSTFRTIPDVPVGTFELTLPQGYSSALAANGKLCSPTRTALVKRKVTVTVKGHAKTVTRKVRETLPSSLQMPTAFTAQNGAIIHESTPISVTGCTNTKKSKKSHKAR